MTKNSIQFTHIIVSLFVVWIGWVPIARATPLESNWNGDPDAPPDRPRNSWQMDAAATLWPMCGGAYEADEDLFTCPPAAVGNTDEYSDLQTINDTFGPRTLNYQPLDWHRGLDLTAECGEPVFAIADGVIKRLHYDSSETSDPYLAVRHCTNDTSQGCYYSYYRHLSGLEVGLGDSVVQGQQLGWSGYSNVGERISTFADANGYEPSYLEICAARVSSDYRHLHFEVLESSTIKYGWTYSGNAVHPLEVLPYVDTAEGNVTIIGVDQTGPKSLSVSVELEFPRDQADMGYVDVDLYKYKCPQGTPTPLIQDGDLDPSGDRYFSNLEGNKPTSPTWFGLDRWNWVWSHRNSSFPYDWDTETEECPHGDVHGPSYASNIHLELDMLGTSFNGLTVIPGEFDDLAPWWTAELTYGHFVLPKNVKFKDVCVKAQVYDVHGTLVGTDEVGCSC